MVFPPQCPVPEIRSIITADLRFGISTYATNFGDAILATKKSLGWGTEFLVGVNCCVAFMADVLGWRAGAANGDGRIVKSYDSAIESYPRKGGTATA